MFNLFDILQAQSGQSMQALGQQFGLSPEQSRRAVEALLPALSIGLQRNAADPAGFGRLFGLSGFQPGGAPKPSQPDLVLGHLFGSQALSQAVLQQAAAASGIGTQALRQMLPLMAGMIVAGIVHMMLNQSSPALSARVEPEPSPPSFPAADFWKDWMDNFMKAPAGTGSERAAVPPPRSIAESRSEPAPKVEPRQEGAKVEAPSSDDHRDVPLDVLQQMFQTGAQVQEQNVKAMQELFDTFWQRPAPDAAPAATEQPPAAAEPPAQKRPAAEKTARTRAKPADQKG